MPESGEGRVICGIIPRSSLPPIQLHPSVEGFRTSPRWFWRLWEITKKKNVKDDSGERMEEWSQHLLSGGFSTWFAGQFETALECPLGGHSFTTSSHFGGSQLFDQARAGPSCAPGLSRDLQKLRSIRWRRGTDVLEM